MTESQFATLADSYVNQMGPQPEGFVDIPADRVEDRDAFNAHLRPGDRWYSEPVHPQPMGMTIPPLEYCRVRWPRT